MKTTIINKGGESTLTIKGDFYQILDENFTAVCTAISNKIRIHQELQNLSEENVQLAETVINAARSSRSPEEAVCKLQKELNTSEMTAKYLQNLPLTSLGSLNSEELHKKLDNIQAQITKLSSLLKK